jgi:hypothetical protein
MTTPPAGEKKRWLDHPGNVQKLLWALYAVCAFLFLFDALYEKHPHFAAEEWFGFYAIFGFLVFVFIVLAGKMLRKVLMRREDYYDSDADREPRA